MPDASLSSNQTAAHQTGANRGAYVWLTLMVVLWGLSWPATKIALTHVPPLWLGVFRFASAAVCLLGFLAAKGSLHLPKRADLPIVLSIGLLQMAAFTGFSLVAMTYTDTSRSVLLSYTT